MIIYNILFRRIIPIPTKSLLSLFWPTFQSLIYELVDEDGCSSSFDISTRITQCAGFSSIRMYDDHDEVSHWVKSEESEDCKHVFFWIFWLEGLGIYWRYRNRYRAFWVPEKSIGCWASLKFAKLLEWKLLAWLGLVPRVNYAVYCHVILSCSAKKDKSH